MTDTHKKLSFLETYQTQTLENREPSKEIHSLPQTLDFCCQYLCNLMFGYFKLWFLLGKISGCKDIGIRIFEVLAKTQFFFIRNCYFSNYSKVPSSGQISMQPCVGFNNIPVNPRFIRSMSTDNLLKLTSR